VPVPEIGKPLPRAEDAYSTPEKWELWILADDRHGPDWRAVFGEVDAETAWSALAQAVLAAPVVSVQRTGAHVTYRVDVVLTLNRRTAIVRSAWHYSDENAAPRLVTAFPTT
jgi:hypothetical protein